MRLRWRGVLRWFYPGMRVKRWIALLLVSLGAVVFALFGVIGGNLSRLLQETYRSSLWLAFALWAGGGVGTAIALTQLVRSIARGIAPDARVKPSTLIYRTRVLERGPRVVAVGGGTGLSTLLRGLKEETTNLTAIVTVMDDGGSSGRLRQEIDVLPPGDIRNCILALAEDETRLSDYFQYRFSAPTELAGHSLGNLVIAGLEQATGGFDRAIEAMSDFLSIRGRVLPATLTRTHLRAEMSDGEFVEGEAAISQDPRAIKKMHLSTPAVEAYDSVIAALREADLIILGPGSLFTSIIPNLLVGGIANEIEQASAEKIVVANLMTQPGETTGFALSDHLRVLDEYVNLRRFDTVFVNSERPLGELLDHYADEAAEPTQNDLATGNDYGLTVIAADMLGTAHWCGKETIKHDPKKLTRTLVRETAAFSQAHRSSSP